MNPKRKRTIIIVAVVLVLVLIAVGIWLAVRSGSGDGGHQHTPILVEAKEPTCTEAGNKAYYRCECGKFFTDEECKNETTEAEQIIPAISHDALTDGNCTTEDKCPYCNEIIGEAQAEHIDKDGDFICDNKNCAVTLEGAPKDENEGIDLPIDRN